MKWLIAFAALVAVGTYLGNDALNRVQRELAMRCVERSDHTDSAVEKCFVRYGVE